MHHQKVFRMIRSNRHHNHPARPVALHRHHPAQALHQVAAAQHNHRTVKAQVVNHLAASHRRLNRKAAKVRYLIRTNINLDYF